MNADSLNFFLRESAFLATLCRLNFNYAGKLPLK